MKMLFAFPALLLLVGCGTATPTAGIVTDKKVIPAHDVPKQEDVYKQVCDYGYRWGMNPDGTSGFGWRYGCEQQFDYTRHWTEHVPECHQLTFRESTKGGRTGTACVHPTITYAETHVGDYYNAEEGK